MKVAITSTGNSLEAKLDQRFGRCAYFVIYDTETKSTEYFPNPNKDAPDGAGPASVQFIASRKVSKVVSGDFGIKVKPILENLQIQMITLKDQEKNIGEIIEMLNH